MLHALIMAGGAGTRFWPKSRIALPKQLLSFGSNHTLLQQAVNRLTPAVATENISIITNQKLVETIRQQVPQLSAEAVIGEPAKKDTAPCIALAAALIAEDDPNATMIVMPSDHIIQPVEAFQQAILKAVDLVHQNPTSLITFGITPDRPAETYGYIQSGNELSAGVFEVQQFKEKPAAKLAQQYLQEGSYYWNSGIFVWQVGTILDALEETRPDIIKHINMIIRHRHQKDFNDVLAREFSAIRGTSIDYAVMEQYEPVLMIEAPFQWDDIGSWQALSRIFPTDANNNTILSKHVGIDTFDSVIQSSSDHLIATIGVKNMIIVHTDDATLVANKDDEESVRKLTEILKSNGTEAYL
ncbi:MAG: mannose-1-phosphate guanylyltransferase [Planctomycetaceae bacterium]|nr:mannose-1-phosphate guanylyltransferase [Planctomycetaceae bacterium]